VPEAAFVRPALTTVHQDFALVGQRAVEVVLAQLGSGGAPSAPGVPTASVAPTLVVRASTAHPSRA